MKKVLLFFFSIMLSQLSAFAQEDDETISKVDRLYDVHLPLLALKCLDVNGKIGLDTIYKLIKKGARFYTLETKDNGSVIVQFWFDGTTFDTSVVFDSYDDKKINRRNTYLITKKDLENRTRRRYSTGLFSKYSSFSGTSITGGVTILPFKFRPRIEINGKKDGFEFSKDIQLGVSGGIKQRISHYNPFYLNLLINIGISSVTLDDYNTRGTIKDNIDLAALTYAGGVVLDFNKIQFGIFAGKDRISDRNRSNWIYQGKTWWSIGFGYSIFSVSTKPIGSANNK